MSDTMYFENTRIQPNSNSNSELNRLSFLSYGYNRILT